MSGTASSDVVRSRSVSPVEDLAFGVSGVRSGSYEDREDDEGDAQQRVRSRESSSSPSTLASKKSSNSSSSSRPTTPSGGKRRACIVHLDGCRYTIVASPPDLTSSDARTDDATPTMTSFNDTKDTSLPRTGSLTLIKTTMPGKSMDGGDDICHPADGSTSIPQRYSSAAITTTTAAAAARSLRCVSTTSTVARGNDENEEETTIAPSGITNEMDVMERLSAVDNSLVPHFCSLRLRHLLVRLSGDNLLEKDDVIKNLEYVIRRLDSTCAEEIRSNGDDDDDDDDADDLSHRVETDAVPNEVRDWLAMTFTRSTHSAIKRRVNDKPKFRSVANAIRAGILVDRIYRRVSNYVGRHVPAKIATILKCVDEWSFDVFALDEGSEGHALRYIGYDLLQRYDLINKFKMSTQTVDCLLARLEQGYSKYANPYHNMIHAADVTQTMHHVISRSGLSVWLTDIDMLAAIVAALIHDYEHTGTTNTFHINTSSEMALLYNDKAVLENHHISSSFRLLKEDEYNIVSNLKPEEYREFRGLVIDMVLATDMSFHFQQIKNMKATISLRESVDKTKALALIVHCADISHPAKKWELHHRWTELLMEEFFRQGDREASLGIQISPLCDRKNTLVAESQIGFIDFIVDPSLQVMGDMMERIVEQNSSNEETTTTTTTTKIDLHSITANQTKNEIPSSQERSKFHIAREWEGCLATNKHLWKERAERGWISPLQKESVPAGSSAGSEAGKTEEKGSQILRTEDIFSPGPQDDPVETDSGMDSPGLTTKDLRTGKHDLQTTTTMTVTI